MAARAQAPESNTVRVEIMNQDRLTADDHEGYVEWVGEVGPTNHAMPHL